LELKRLAAVDYPRHATRRRQDSAPRLRFLAIVGIFVVIQVIILGLGWGAIEVINAGRAYSAGESLYSKGQKAAVLDLHRYAETGDAAYLDAYRQAIAVPLGDRVARAALEADPPDDATAAEGFRAGGNAPEDIAGLIRLFDDFRDWAPFVMAVADWRDGDRMIEQLGGLAGDLDAEIRRGEGDHRPILAKIDEVDTRLTAIEKNFLGHIGAAARTAKLMLGLGLGISSIVLWLAGIDMAWRSFRKGLAAEQAARDSERRFRDFAETASDWFWEATADRRVSYLSERFTETTGLDPAMLIGNSAEIAGLGTALAGDGGAIEAAMTARQPFKGLCRLLVMPDGSRRWWKLSGMPVHGPDGQFLGYRGTGTDITTEIAAHEALEAAKAGAEAASEAKSQFLAHLSHEFRTPLNAILGFAELIKDAYFGPVPPRYAGYAGDVFNSGQHLLSLVNDILDLTKIEAGRGELVEEAVDIAGLLACVTRLMHDRLDAAGLVLETIVPDRLPPVRGDLRKLKQMLINLVANAVKFTPAGGAVRIEAGLTEAGCLELRVRDTGIGIAPQNLSKVLSPFGQLENPMARRHPGTGLGLSLTKALAELHGGRLELESAPGIGTSVTILLPAERLMAEAA
jgi:PAS domain S-box-containing protein